MTVGNERAMGTAVLAEVRRRRPLIHCITNYVTAGDVANLLLAAGASPVMAEGLREVEDIAAVSQGLVLNLGTLKEQTVDAMLLAGTRTAALGHPVVLDPVGAGSIAFRRETAWKILGQVPCALIRGNASEIRALAELAGDETASLVHRRGGGVDADGRDAVTEENESRTLALMQALSRRMKAAVLMTGQADLLVDGDRACLIEKGTPMLGRITGSGCMMDGFLAACLAGSGVGADRFSVLAWGAAAFGVCGELAEERCRETGGGTGSFRMYLMDAMSCLTDSQAARRARIRELDLIGAGKRG